MNVYMYVQYPPVQYNSIPQLVTSYDTRMVGARSPSFDSATAAGPNALVLSFAVSFLVLAAFNQTVLFLPPSTP